MNDRLKEFIETTQLFGSKVKLRLEEGYFVGFICKPLPDAQQEDPKEACVTLNQVILKSACSEDCHFPEPLCFKYSEIEDFELLDCVLSSDLPKSSSVTSPQSSCKGYNPQTNSTKKHADEVSDTNSLKKFSSTDSQRDSPKNLNGQISQNDGHVRFKDSNSISNDSRDSGSNSSKLKDQGLCSTNLPTASKVDVKFNACASEQNVDAIVASGSDLRLKNLSFYAEKFEYDQLNNENFTCELPQTYFLVETPTFSTIAMDIIKEESQIGCAFKGIDLGPKGTLGSIQISTKEYVFVFDALNLLKKEDFQNDLKSVLENDKIEKVTFDCRKASQLLRCQFDTHLTNVYDIQVADIMIQRQNSKGALPKYLRKLIVLLVGYLNLPEDHVRFYQDRRRTFTNNSFLSKRPMSKQIVELAAFGVRYHLELKRKTTILLMAEFKFAVNLFINDDDNQRNDLVPSEFSRFDYSSSQSNSNSSCCSPATSTSKHVNANIKDCNSTSHLAKGENYGDDSTPSKSDTNCSNEGLRTNSQRFHEPQKKNNFKGNSNNFRGNGNNFRGNGNNFRGNGNNFRRHNNNRGTNKCEEGKADSKPKEIQIYPTGMTRFN